MPAIIRIKRSSQPGGVPQTLMEGELAYNLADRVLYIGGPNGEIHQFSAEGQVVAVAAASFVAANQQPTSPPTPLPGFTTGGIRRRLLPFEN